MKSSRKTKAAEDKRRTLTLCGTPNKKQAEFFKSEVKYTAYGGARGGGKSWALRRKLILMALRYPGIKILIIRRSYPELRENHILPMLSELKDFAEYTELSKCFTFPADKSASQSRILLGYCASESDVLQYQGQEYDIIAIDEATQLTEYQFNTLKACLRGANAFPKRMYLTCNPGGVGHAWFKRLFIDRSFREGENPADYLFIQALVYDNTALISQNGEYLSQLKSLPERLKNAWLYGNWEIFNGQFFTEFDTAVHVCAPYEIPAHCTKFAALDYGFDMLACLWCACDGEGNICVYRELCRPNLTLSEAAQAVYEAGAGEDIEYISASPDLWNRRQDTGYSGFEIMSRCEGLPPLIRADNRRIIGWRTIREYLKKGEGGARLRIFSTCGELIRCLPLLAYDKLHPEDASGEPHSITHAPEALRYAVMSRPALPADRVGINSQNSAYNGKNSIINY